MSGSRFLRRSEVHANSPLPTVSELNLILLGPPGAGKSTQAERLQEDFDLDYIATGDILRKAVADGTELGQKAKEYMDNGDLVPDEVIIGVILEEVATQAQDGFLLDGFPRSVGQAEALEEALARLDRHLTTVLCIEARDDDREETVRKRLAVYHRQTSPLVRFYEERDLLRRFDGTRSPTEVHDHIRATIATLRLEDEL